jgi:hypothetical protein
MSSSNLESGLSATFGCRMMAGGCNNSFAVRLRRRKPTQGLFVSALPGQGKIKDLKALDMPSPYHALEPIADAISQSLGIEFSPGDKDLLDVLEHAI